MYASLAECNPNEDLCRFYLSLLHKDCGLYTDVVFHSCPENIIPELKTLILLDLCLCIEEMMTGCKVRK
jgi:hypothetical protein